MSKELKAIHNRFGDADIRWYNADDVDALLAEKDAEIARLKGDLKDSWDDRADSLKMLVEKDKEIESLKASHYAEMVDAGMRERRLKVALWLARAERADDRARIFYFNDLDTILDIDGYSYDSRKKKTCKKMGARLWRITWLKVWRKCLAMAERYGEAK